MKKVISLVLILLSFGAYAVNQGETITAKRYNESTFGIGDVRTSILSKTEFQNLYGSCWKQMSQAISLSGTDLASHTSLTTIPDMSGKFIRNAGGLAEANAGTVQADATAKNGLNVSSSSSTAGNHQHHNPIIVYASGKNNSWIDYGNEYVHSSGAAVTYASSGGRVIPLTDTQGNHTHTITSTVNSSDNETRPENFTVHMYVKVNHECN